jgi:hypothetical protein
VHPEIQEYNLRQESAHRAVCDFLAQEIDGFFKGAENKLWHAHPVWFLAGNPIVGYSKEKAGIRLMFWSGAGFEEEGLNVLGKKFKDASVFYNDVSEINNSDLHRWLEKSRKIQWDYKNIVKKKGRLDRL